MNKKPATPSTSTTPRTTDFRNKLQQFNSQCPSPSPVTAPRASTDANEPVGAPEEGTTWTHLKLSWAQAANRKDAKGRKMGHPDYDSRTLYVPDSFLKGLTPAMRQWWELKSKNFETILFFKVGKFYEFYHWDACIAAKELGITYMRASSHYCLFAKIFTNLI